MKHGVRTKHPETRVVGKPITSSWVAEFMLEMPILYDVLLGLDFSALIAAQAVCTAWRDGVKYHSFLWKVVCGRIGVRADSRAAARSAASARSRLASRACLSARARAPRPWARSTRAWT